MQKRKYEFIDPDDVKPSMYLYAYRYSAFGTVIERHDDGVSWRLRLDNGEVKSVATLGWPSSLDRIVGALND